MMTKRLRTIDLSSVLLEEEEASEDKDPNHTKKLRQIRSWFHHKEEKSFQHSLFILLQSCSMEV